MGGFGVVGSEGYVVTPKEFLLPEEYRREVRAGERAAICEILSMR